MVCLLLLLAACEPRRDAGYMSLDEAVEFAPPPGFARQEVQGIDTEIREYRSDDAQLIISWGWYDGPRSCNASTGLEVRIDGRDGVRVSVEL